MTEGRPGTTLPSPRDRLLIFTAGAVSMLAVLVGAVAYGLAKGDCR